MIPQKSLRPKQKKNLFTYFLKGPVTYDGKAPKDIKFVPLKLEKAYTGTELLKYFETTNDQAMVKYFTLIKNSTTWPVLLDSDNQVLCLPPVINSKLSQITVDTKKVLIEVTSQQSLQACKDIMKVLLQKMTKLVSSDKQLVIEQVKVISDDGHVRIQYPNQKELQDICSEL